MSNSKVALRINIDDLILEPHEVSEFLEFVNNKRFLKREWVGKGSGFAGSDYNYKITNAEERVELRPMDESVWLYLNTFGKENK